MKGIEIKYHGIFGGKTIKRSIPENWNEMSQKQVKRICQLLYAPKMDIYRFRILAVKHIFSLSWLQILMIRERLVDLFQFVKFIEDANLLTRNPYPSIKIGFIKLYGPLGDFSTLKAEEWTEADTAFMEYNQSREDKDLDRFLAVLYRPRQKDMGPDHPKWQGDYRLPYNEHTVNYRAKILAKLDKSVKTVIVTWYMACRTEWETVFERVFRESGEMGMENFGWQETVQKLSGSTFGDLETTMGNYMYRLMLNMEITLKDEEIRKEQERINKMKKL